MKTKKLSATLTLIMMMTIAVSMMSVAYAPDEVIQIAPLNGTVNTTILPHVEPSPVGVGQNLSVQVLLYPPPARDVNITVRLTRPNGTYIYLDTATNTWTTNASNRATMHGTDDFPQLELFNVFKPDVAGTWFVRAAFDGLTNDDTYYRPANATQQWPIIVTTEQQPLPNDRIVTRAYIGTSPGTGIAPGKVGTGENIYLVGWVSPARELKGGIYHTDLDFVITKPDGTTERIPKKMDSPATASFNYLCTQAGTYSVRTEFAGDVYPTFQFLPCVSPTITWIVEDGYTAPKYPDEPLPTGQWKYPINAEKQQWYQISGPWPVPIGGQGSARFDASGSSWNPNTKGPNSAHVLWTNDFGQPGGLMGGEVPVGGDTKSLSSSNPSFVSWQGYLWYTTTQQVQSTTVGQVPTSQPVVVMVDQYTGKEIKRQVLPGTGSVGLWLELNPREKIDPRQSEQVGVTTNLWATGGGALRLLNPFTLQCSYYNSTVGTPKFYHDGHFYFVDDKSATGGEQWIRKWSTADRTDIWTVPAGRVYNSGAGFYLDSDVTPNRIVMACRSFGMWPITSYIKSWNAETGEIICNATKADWYTTEAFLVNEVGWGKFYYHDYDMSIVAIDTSTGLESWRSEPQVHPWGDFNAYNMARGYHLIFSNSWDGYQYAYVAETGDLAWKAFSAESLGETAMGVYAWWGQSIVGDEKVYTATAQHTQPSPPSRGDALYCINALTGEQVWKLDHFQNGGGQSLASGILTYGNAYDGRVYAFAQGPTQTTVSAEPKVVSNGAAVLVEGTVMDMSPGAPNTPCVSDDSQNQWMQFLYMDYPCPTNATGVVVHLEYIGPDGVVKDMTHVTSDLMGHYEYLWTPPAEGAYKVIATLDPTNSYYMSQGQTAVGVVAAHETVEPEAAPDYTMLMYGLIGGIVAAIVIGVVSLMLIMRKK